MSKPSAPRPPDPAQTAAAQTGVNVNTAVANQVGSMVNQSTPFGTLTYQRAGQGDITPQQQARLDDLRWTSANAQNADHRAAAERQLASLEGRIGSGGDGYAFRDPTTGQQYYVPRWEAVQNLTPEGQQVQDATVNTQINLANLGQDQSARLQGLLSEPVSTDGMPGRGGNARAATMERVSGGPTLATSIPGAGSITRSIPGQTFDGRIADAGAMTRTYGTDFSQDRQRVEDALMSRMNPSLERDREGLRTSLLNQGVREGTEAFDRAMSRFGEQANDARMQAILAGGQEQSRMVGLEAGRAGFENAAQAQQFGQNVTRTQSANDARQMQFQSDAARAQFANQAQQQQFGQNATGAAFGNDARQQMFGNQLQAVGVNNTAAQQDYANTMAGQQRQDQLRQQAMQEQFAMRNQPINEITALLSGSQVSQPNFVNTPSFGMPATDYAGLVGQNYAGQMAAYNQNMAGRNSMMGGLFGLGAAGIAGAGAAGSFGNLFGLGG